jgi:hypothetical protein
MFMTLVLQKYRDLYLFRDRGRQDLRWKANRYVFHRCNFRDLILLSDAAPDDSSADIILLRHHISENIITSLKATAEESDHFEMASMS